MSRNKKPRKPYRPRPIAVNTLDLALHRAAKPAAADRAEVLGKLSQCLTALRQGVATEQDWCVVAGSVAVAKAIERQGVVRGLHEHLDSAEQALQAIYNRALDNGGGQWLRATLYYQELDVLQAFFNLHSFQVQQLGRAEFLAAIDEATKEVIRQGYTVQQVKDIATMAAQTVRTGQQEQMMAA